MRNLAMISIQDKTNARNGIWAQIGVCVMLLGLLALTPAAGVAEPTEITAERLYNAGLALAERTQYLEALDLLSEAGDLLEASGKKQSRAYGDVLVALAQTKIKGRLHQNFPASYVKTALKEIQAANKLRERLSDVLPQQLAEGYYLEGFIHKKFFLRKEKARSCLDKAVKIDPGFAAAKRELSELQDTDKK